MSGIVGILNGELAPIDSALLQQMTDYMAFRGPDAQHTWNAGNIGFGHALLRTTPEAERELQPHSLDEQVWITADARIDGRLELISLLRDRGCAIPFDTPDVDLILHAYKVWEEACLDYLSGDFAFAIWDSRQQRLFCACDQFGVVPFYYAKIRNGLIFSNTLNCLRLHPDLSDRLNEQTIGDFLLVGMNMNLATTTFADIQKLPPAHSLTWSAGELRVLSYWQLPEVNGYLRYQREEQYVEEFRELFRQAVADRLRTDRAGVHLSGGMDSTSIAATAYNLLAATRQPVDFRAYTIVYKQLIPDDEGDYAKQVAEQFGFPIEYLVAEEYLQSEPKEPPPYGFPEPLLIPNQVAETEITRRVAAYSRVLLVGFGGDPVLYPESSYWYNLLKKWQVGHLLLDGWRYIRTQHRLPRVGLRANLRAWLAKFDRQEPFPDWFNPDFAQRVDLRTRLAEILASTPQNQRKGMTDAPLWSNIFAWSDPGFTGLPVKSRFPFFDLRLVIYLLSVPPVPWFENKLLLREAMRGVLPESVRQRPKTTLRGNPHYNLMQQRGVQPWMVDLASASALTPYVNRELILSKLEAPAELTPATYNKCMLPLILSYWLRYQQR